MKKILITGANSYVGTSLESYLGEQEGIYQVKTVDMIGDGWKDISFADYDAVFHVAGIAHSDNGKISKEQEALYYKVNTELAISVAQKAKNDGAKQFIFMSSAIVYGEAAELGEKKIITKETLPTPANAYGDSKLKAEEGIFALESDKFKIVILRVPMVYGKGCKGNYPLLVKLSLRIPFFPKVTNERSMIYIVNLLEFVRLMIENEERGLFWPCNAEYSNTSEMVQLIASVHGKKIVLVPGMSWLIRGMGCLFKVFNKAFGNLVYDVQIGQYKENYRKYSLRESIKEIEG